MRCTPKQKANAQRGRIYNNDNHNKTKQRRRDNGWSWRNADVVDAELIPDATGLSSAVATSEKGEYSNAARQ